MGSSRDGHWLEKEERNSRSLFNLLGLFGSGQPVKYHPDYVRYLANQQIANRSAEIEIYRRNANIANGHRHCRIGRVTIKAQK